MAMVLCLPSVIVVVVVVVVVVVRSLDTNLLSYVRWLEHDANRTTTTAAAIARHNIDCMFGWLRQHGCAACHTSLLASVDATEQEKRHKDDDLRAHAAHRIVLQITLEFAATAYQYLYSTNFQHTQHLSNVGPFTWSVGPRWRTVLEEHIETFCCCVVLVICDVMLMLTNMSPKRSATVSLQYEGTSHIECFGDQSCSYTLSEH